MMMMRLFVGVGSWTHDSSSGRWHLGNGGYIYICIVCMYMYNVYAKEKEKRKKKRKKALTYLDSILYKAWLKGEKPDRKGVGDDDDVGGVEWW